MRATSGVSTAGDRGSTSSEGAGMLIFRGCALEAILKSIIFLECNWSESIENCEKKIEVNDYRWSKLRSK